MRVKIKFLNAERTEALVTLGWFSKNTAHVILRREHEPYGMSRWFFGLGLPRANGTSDVVMLTEVSSGLNALLNKQRYWYNDAVNIPLAKVVSGQK